MRLWELFKKTKSPSLRERLVETYLPLVRCLARSVCSSLPRSVDPEDLASAGVCGLLKAIDSYDLDRGTSFETYCRKRVRGSMLDELRSQDWIPREARDRGARFAATAAKLRERLGREPTNRELAAALHLSVARLQSMIVKLSFSSVFSIHSGEFDRSYNHGAGHANRLPVNEDDPPEIVYKQELTSLINRDLNRVEKIIIMLYYHEGITLKKIGTVLDISESRVCQILSSMLDRLKTKYAAEV